MISSSDHIITTTRMFRNQFKNSTAVPRTNYRGRAMLKLLVDNCSKSSGNISLKYLQRRSPRSLDMMQSGFRNDVNVKPPNILVFTTSLSDQAKNSILKKVI